MNGRPVLELDDPLAPRAPTAPDASDSDRESMPVAPKAEPRPRARRSRPKPVATAADRHKARVSPDLSLVGEGSSSSHASSAWRDWTGASRVASYRLPDELLEELDDRARRLGVPIGMTVAAGLLQLLDQDDEAIVDLVERAEDARVMGRRAARRRT
jgi:hypothetical protein